MPPSPRRERRRPAGQDRTARVASGEDLEARRVQRLHTAGQLARERTPLQVIEVVRTAVAVAEEAVGKAQAREPPRAPAACREGCAWCCHRPVGVAAPEVLRIVAYLKETLTAEEWEGLRARVVSGAAQRRALDPAARRRSALPCPLLVDNRCVAYAVRPLTCHGFNSSDARRCEAALGRGDSTAVPMYAPQQRLYTFVLDGLRAGLQESRLDGELLELAAALEIAMQAPDVEARWLAGEAVFAPGRLR